VEEQDILLLEEETKRLEETERRIQQEKEQHLNRLREARRVKIYQLQARLSELDSSLATDRAAMERMTAEIAQLNQSIQHNHQERTRVHEAREEALRRAEELGQAEQRLTAEIATLGASIADVERSRAQVEGKIREVSNNRADVSHKLQQLSESLNDPHASPSMSITGSLASVSLPPAFLSALNALESHGFRDPAQNFEVLLRNAGNLEASLRELQARARS
jgi:chromosome segregation ATPase